MTELELHLIRQRMASGRLAKAGRGELAVLYRLNTRLSG
jgi:hypothetical protein